MENKKYFIGLDIGTSSVGWAVTDEENKILKLNKKSMWGSRIFDEGETAKLRRNIRSNRRRKDRKKYRLSLLQEIFNDEIAKIDPNFFFRLEESYLHETDRTEKTKYNLFIKEDYNDFNYYNEYKTIYHLRHKIMTEDKKFDIRLIYLACHHIIKHRGNFIYEDQNFNIEKLSISEKILEVLELMMENDLLNIETINIDTKLLEKILLDTNLNKISASKDIVQLIPNLFYDKKKATQFASLITGRKTVVADLFEIESKEKISFDVENLEIQLDKIEGLEEKDYEIILELKKIYDAVFLKKIFKNSKESSISSVMIEKFNKNTKDLKLLKKIFNKHLTKEEYNDFFRNEKIGKNFNTYIKNTSKLHYEDFKKIIKKYIEPLEFKEKDEMLDELEKDNFLRLLKTTDNSAFPYQLHLSELKKILENQSKYYPFLTQKTNFGENKIEVLLKFRIPYYVGPLNLNADKSGNPRSFAWIKKYKQENINPYNFNEVVDLVGSAEEFIIKMTNFCTYLPREKVIAKNSLLYTKYMVLSELKQIKIDNKTLDNDVIHNILENLFIKSGKSKITKTDLLKFLEKNKIYVSVITGFQKENEFATNMKVYQDFINIFGSINNKNIEMIENLIKWITIFEDKKILKMKIKSTYPQLPDEITDAVCKKTYKGWGRLSKEFLLGESGLCYYENETKYSIMDLLEETGENLIQILNNKKYNFSKLISEYNYNQSENQLEVEDFPCSPAVKKGMNQSIKIVEEIIKIMGRKPEHIFIEMTRSEETKKRKVSRKNKLLKLYNLVKEEVKTSYNTLNEYNKISYGTVKQQLSESEKLDDKRLYLYFIQHGKCLYSGKPLNINELEIYEVDHIVPRSLIKDDSFDNLALVLKEENQRKLDGLTLSDGIQKQQQSFWDYLHKTNFISNKKYYNLSKKHFKDEDIEGFIKRQIVETSQTIIYIAQLFNSKYGEDMVVSVRANLSHNYRERHELYKFRQLNDFHHAKDAYLACALGNYLLKRYPNQNEHFIYSKYEYRNYFSDKGKYNKLNYYGFILDQMENPYADKNGVVIIDVERYTKNINKFMRYNDVLISKKSETYTGKFYKEKLISGRTTSNLVPIRSGKLLKKHSGLQVEKDSGLSVEKYGGYTGVEKAYSILVEYKKGKKIERKVVGIPLYIAKEEETKKGRILEFLNKELGDPNFKILKDKIKKGSLLIYKGQQCYLCSSTEVSNANQLRLESNNNEIDKFNKVLNYICNNKVEKEIEYDKDIDELWCLIIRKIDKYYPIYKNLHDKLIQSHIEENYYNLSLDGKKEVILQLLKILRANSENGNLKSIGLTDREGRLAGQNINSGKIINTSITGLLENNYEF